ncbi:hypothetical protein ACQKMI_10650 [Lysinibacillus sp. NPDC097214]|uniref:hypothetical protein n=1 Tax=Lysinibacillus sp. NPDC097214 TaxID=3390584 RepID=UPI003D00FAE5
MFPLKINIEDTWLIRLSKFVKVMPYVYPDNLRYKAEYGCVVVEEALQNEEFDSLKFSIDYLKDNIGNEIYKSVINRLIEKSVNVDESDEGFIKHVENSDIGYNSFTIKTKDYGVLYIPNNATLYLDKEYTINVDTKDEFNMILSLGYELVKGQEYPIYFVKGN